MISHGPLMQMAELLGVHPSYVDNFNKTHEAPLDSLVEIMCALEPELKDSLVNAEQVWRRKINEKPILPKTIICHTGSNKIPKIRQEKLEVQLVLENNSKFDWIVPHDEVAVTLSGLPEGYHQLIWKGQTQQGQSFIICAPSKCYTTKQKNWGAFTPIYSLKSQTNWGVGDFGDLENLMNFIHSHKGDFVATLPILANLLDGPAFEFSPYSPASRLFWNELFLSWNHDVPKETATWRETPHVQYREIYKAKKKVILEHLKQEWSKNTETKKTLNEYVVQNPDVYEYARFRAICHIENKLPSKIPDLHKKIETVDMNHPEVLFHVFVQWLCNQQLSTLTARTQIRLYLDFPLGVNGEGYDVWKNKDLFVQPMSVGCPPDELFTLGQNWGFPPLHPQKLEQTNFAYFIKCLSHHMKFANVLRIDHMMSFHRLFWIPPNKSGKMGAYVSYPYETLYAILRLESQRNKTIIVGEDLGVVPPITRHKMDEYDLNRIWVGQLELWQENVENMFKTIPAKSAASLNTHDIPTFTSFWQGTDIQDRVDIKYITPEMAEKEKLDRKTYKERLSKYLKVEKENDVFQKFTAEAAASNAQLLVVNLEDCWSEPLPQNTPGTVNERPNWQRKHKLSLNEIKDHAGVNETLKVVQQKRKG